VPASAINTGALAKAFQYELNQALLANGLDASVSVAAADGASGRRRRRLAQAAGATVTYTITVMVPAGRDAADVLGKAKAAAQATATNRDVLRRLLASAVDIGSLDIEDLITAMIASTKVEGEVAADAGSTRSPSPGGKSPSPGSKSPAAPSGKSPSPSPGGKSPGPAAANTATVEITQNLPGVAAADVDTKALGDGMATEVNEDLAAKGLTASVTAIATDSGAAASGRRLLQASPTYGGDDESSSTGCTIIYIIIIPIPKGQNGDTVAEVAQSTAEGTATDPDVLMVLLKASLPPGLLANIEKLIQAMIESTVGGTGLVSPALRSPKPVLRGFGVLDLCQCHSCCYAL
jgi:hypothetical protein